MKKLFATAGALLAVLAAVVATVVAVRTATFPSRQVDAPPAPPLALDTAAVVQRLADAVRYRTISTAEGPRGEAAEFERFRAFLASAFPRVHGALAREVVAEHSLLYTWAGTDPAAGAILLTGHYDVVPVEPGTEDHWTHPPFSGVVADGYVWGRGTLDDKAGVMGILEAVEVLLAEGFAPARTVYIAFGHDEEVGGEGARRMAESLHGRGVRMAYVLDEGGAVFAPGTVPGVDAPVALVGIAEKGYVSLELSVRAAGGHSSMPPRETAAGIVSAAVHRLERNPFPGALAGVSRETFAYLGPEMALPQRAVFANLWLFGPLVRRTLDDTPGGAAMLRTTTAATMLRGSVKDNVLPVHAAAVVNFRILPGETVESVESRVRRVVADDRVEVRRYGASATNPSPVSDPGGEGFHAIQTAIRRIYPDALAAPYLVMGATDARHYAILSDQVFRFLPLRLAEADLARLHGTDERVSVAAYLDAVRFYRQLLTDTVGGGAG
jgi:carboxypeptidase PM20D1